jgi:hypothetical protein
VNLLHSVVTLSQTQEGLPKSTNVAVRNFKGLARWQIVHIGPCSVNVTTSGQGWKMKYVTAIILGISLTVLSEELAVDMISLAFIVELVVLFSGFPGVAVFVRPK